MEALIGGAMEQSAYNMKATADDIQGMGTKVQADHERLRAKEEGNARRERLLNALAAQNAMGGASGATGGTAKALQMESIGDYRQEQELADVQSQAAQTGYKISGYGLQASSAGNKAMGKMAMRKSLFKAAESFAKTG